jgi:hypothetical protein
VGVGIPKRESVLVLGLMLLAGIRVAVYATLLPALTRPDELQHYDRILSVVRGESNGGVRRLSDEAIGAFFLALKDESPAGPGSARAQPQSGPTEKSGAPAPQIDYERNHEFCEPPLYYEIAASWHELGMSVVWRHSQMPYWDRYLNVPFVAGLVGLGSLVARRLFIGAARLIVPIFLALLPQSDLYGINNDALMPIVFGLFLFAYLRLCEKPASVAWSLFCGLTLAAGTWTKTTSVPLVAVGCLAFAQTLLTRQRIVPRLLAFVCGLLATVPLYLANLRTFGHLTGAFTKMQMQGYTVRPFVEWFRHPLFTPAGFVEFFTELTNSYWLGEMSLNHWQGQVLLHAPYILVWLCPLITLVILGGVWRRNLGSERRAVTVCWASFVASAAFLAVCSAPMDFGIHPTPTAWWSFPGFVGGRLMIGTLLPFAVLTGSACERLPRLWRMAVPLTALVALNVVSAWLLADAFGGRFSVSSIVK